MYSVHRNTCRIYPSPRRFNHSKYASKLCRWKSQRNYCSGDYFVPLMQHVDHIKLYLLRTEVGIYRVTGMLIKTGRGITRGPIPLITWESDAAAVWCKCTRSNASALAMLPRRADTLRVNPICPQGSRYDHTDSKRFQVKPPTTSFPPSPKAIFNLRRRARSRISIRYERNHRYFPHTGHTRCSHRAFTFEIPEK